MRAATTRSIAFLLALVACHFKPWLGPVVLAVIGVWSLRKWACRAVSGDTTFQRLVIAVYLSHVAVAATLFAISYFQMPLFRQLQVAGGFWTFTPDSDGYHLRALAILEALKHGGDLPALTPTAAYEVVVAIVYLMFGPYPLAATIVNCWLVTATGLIAVSLVRRWEALPAVSYGTLVAVACWPSGFIWSSQLLRDCLAWFCTFGALFAIAKILDASGLRDRAVIRHVPLLLLMSASASIVRTYVGWLLVAASLPVVLWIGVHWRPLLPKLPNVLLVTALLTAGTLAGTGRLFSTFHKNVAIANRLEPIVSPDRRTLGKAAEMDSVPDPVLDSNLMPRLIEQKRRELLVGSNSSIGPDADVLNWQRLFKFLPVGVATVLVGPFPWEMSTGKSTGVLKSLATIEGVALFLSLPVLVIGWARAARSSHASAVFVLSYGLLCLVFIAVMVPNLGGAVRLRPQALFSLFVVGFGFSVVSLLSSAARLMRSHFRSQRGGSTVRQET